MRKLVAAIACRNNGSRLYGKPLQNLDIERGVTILDHLIDLLKTVPQIDGIVLGISEGDDNVVFKEYARKHSIDYIIGDEKDVLQRLIQCGGKAQATDIFRITSESPFTYFELIESAWQEHVNNNRDATFVDNVPDGSNFEIIKLEALERSHRDGEDKHRSELCTLYIREKPQMFSIKQMQVPLSFDRKDIRLTVDYPEDSILCRAVYEEFKGLAPRIPVAKIIKFLDSRPDLLKLIAPFCPQGYEMMYTMKDEESNVVVENPKFAKSNALLAKAKEIIPCAAQTYSKSYRYFTAGAAPLFLQRGEGSHVFDVDGNEYVDFICGLGAVLLGYNNSEVNRAVQKQLPQGISFSQPTEIEVELAQKIIEIVPCAQMVRFVKNGSDATTAAVRLARAHTKKDIVFCSGYHGFQDWYVAATKLDLGIPRALKDLVETFEYNDVGALQDLFEKHKDNVACIIMEPMQQNGPNQGYLAQVKMLAKENGALLIFDEVVSGFRMALGGAQEYFRVTPDLAAIGKGMGNGLALSAVVGRRDVMRLIDDGAFISSTFGGEALSLAGALATIRKVEEPGFYQHIWGLGNRWKQLVADSIEKKNMGSVVSIVGAAPHCGVLFTGVGNLTNHQLFSVFQQELIEQGFLSLGINNFCLAHTMQEVERFAMAADKALDKVQEAVRKGSVEGILKGSVFTPIFKRN